MIQDSLQARLKHLLLREMRKVIAKSLTEFYALQYCEKKDFKDAFAASNVDSRIVAPLYR